MTTRVGQQLGNYHPIRLLGQSSFAEVYLGEHVELKTQVAIKVLQTRLPIGSQESFLAEVHTLTRLRHPNIVRILEAGVEDNIPFLIMDYAPYGTLRQHYPKGTRLSQENILSYVHQLTAALQYMHNQKLIHRNVKPESMLLGPDNTVLLSDFGLALTSQSSSSQNMEEMVGRVAYMAPEQLKGTPCPASDQYALGIVIYEWLSGDSPFHGSFTEIARQQAFVPPPPLHEKVPEISLAVEEVVLIALAKDPKLRFASVKAFANALEQASRSGQPSPAARTFYTPNPSALPDGLSDNATQLPADNAAELSTEEHNAQTVSEDAPSPPLTLPTQQRPPRHPRPSMVTAGKAGLLIALALLIVIGSVGFIYYTIVPHPPQLQAQTPSAAQTMLTAQAQTQTHIQMTETAQANTNAQATAQVLAMNEATVTATALNNLYIQATSGSPALVDPLSRNDANSWNVGTSSRGESCAFIGGAYHVIEPQLYSFYPCFANATNFSNFAFQAQVTILKGNLGGLVFLADQAHANYCLFGLDSDGKYQFFCFIHGSGTLGLNTVNAPVGHKSPQANLLTVIVRSNYIFLYVNKQYVGSIKQTFLNAGEIGVFAYDTAQPTDVAFSNAQVWNL